MLLLKEIRVSQGGVLPAEPFETGEIRHVATYTWTVPAASAFTWNPPADFAQAEKLAPASGRPRIVLLGKPAPDFTLQPVHGGDPVTLASFRGKTVLLDFWATWCFPCRDLEPSIAGMAAKGKDKGLVVLGIAGDESVERFRST
jgi:thiol-disulfide isomerase/thioredoxin